MTTLAWPGTALEATPRHPRSTVVIAHRGASGYRPEHTLAAYELAIEQGADAIEPDVVATRDGVLVARHETEISGTTDVAAHPELADRRTTRVVDGREQTGWFVEDLTLAELRTLRATERLGALRPANRLYDGRWSVVTLDEILVLLLAARRRTGRRIGLVVELKHAAHLAARGLHVDDLLLATLARHGLHRADGDGVDAGVVVESFEVGVLRRLARRCDLPLVQLVDEAGHPVDRPGGPSYAQMTTPAGLAAIATYARGVSLHKDLVLPRDPRDGSLAAPTGVVRDAHAAGLFVLVWTLRAENVFLPTGARRGDHPAAHGDLAAEVRAHVEAGVDGVFTDFPDLAREPARRTPVR